MPLTSGPGGSVGAAQGGAGAAQGGAGAAQGGAGAAQGAARLPVGLAPILLGLILAGPTLAWPFLWDDFDFLGRAATLGWRDLLPSGDVVFYRPLSREIYFWLLYHLGGASPIVAHIAAATIFAGILLLVMSIGRRLAGCRAGVIATFALAASAAVPLALGWISAVQDLLCCFFVLAAIRLQLSKKTLSTAVAMMAALLSKEVAVAFAPIPVVIAHLDRSERPATLRAAVAQAVVVVLWAALHPSLRGMASGAGVGGGDEYVGFRGPAAAQSIAEGLALTLNIPWLTSMSLASHLLPWALAGTVALAAGIVVVGRLCAGRAPGNAGVDADKNPRMLAVIGLMAWLGPIVVTSLVVHRWFTYYALLPATGLSLLVGLCLRRSRAPVVFGAIALFLWIGIGFRGARLDSEVPSEMNFREAGLAMNRIERGFMKLHPTLPSGANVFVSVQTRGHGGLYRHLFRAQPLRVWYHQPQLWVLDPNRRQGAGGTDFLFWITPELDVCEINPITLEPRGPKQVIHLAQYQKTLRGYAFGLAGVGGVDRAVQILITMPEPSQEAWLFDRKTAAALYFAAGREREALQMLAQLPRLDRPRSISAATALLIEPITGLDLDVAAMRAFDLDPSDVGALRTMMRYLDAAHASAAPRLALRVLAQAPGDPEAVRVVREASRAPQPKDIVRPVPHDIPQ